MKSDAELLREFVEKRSESSFTELVQRHLDFVYSAVLRQVGGDAHLAKDAAQLVFCDLARKAASLLHHQAITGWLYRAAHFAAAKIVRTERRRHAHELEASLLQNVTTPETQPDWNEVGPIIDSVLLELSQSDREAVLLRFFRHESFAEIGAKLHLPEDTARKRVARALDKLHGLLRRRGIASSTAGVAAMLTQNTVRGAPHGLVDAITRSALNPALAVGGGTDLPHALAVGLPGKGVIMAIFVAAAIGTGAIFYYSRETSFRAKRPLVFAEITENQPEFPPLPEEKGHRESLTLDPIEAKVPARPVLAVEPTALPDPPPSRTDTAVSPPATLISSAPVSVPVKTLPVAITPARSARVGVPGSRTKLQGPHVLYFAAGGSWRLVRQVEGYAPRALIDGKWESPDWVYPDDQHVSSLPAPLTLRPAQHFFPGFIEVANVEDQIVKNRVSFRGSFGSLTPLEHVYIVFVIFSKSGLSSITTEEIGQLTPHQPKFVSEKLGFWYSDVATSYKFYLFSDGVEIIHSRMSAESIERGFDELVSYEMKRSPSAQPQPLLAAVPVYPRNLLEKKISGEVMISVNVNQQGRVEDPKITQSSDPAFSAVALQALGDWRFVPAVKNGAAVASTTQVPFTFAP